MIGGAPFVDTGVRPFRTTALIKLPSPAQPVILNIVSQGQNWLSIQYSVGTPNFAIVNQVQSSLGGLMLPYAGDANGDNQDEIGIYTMALGTVQPRHLQLLSAKGNTINTMPIVDVTGGTGDSFRGMALGFLGNNRDLRTSLKLKDLIMLVEDRNALTSRLVIRRANLNYKYQ